jgi:hypothetical protein
LAPAEGYRLCSGDSKEDHHQGTKEKELSARERATHPSWRLGALVVVYLFF